MKHFFFGQIFGRADMVNFWKVTVDCCTWAISRYLQHNKQFHN